MNQLILGDNVAVLRQMESETIDLIYLDPPFFSNRTYDVIWGDKGEVRSFEDRFSGGIDHYIAWLKERIVEMHRILKPTGSIFLHCDWHANAYIRVFILDPIFGANNFRNEIVWFYRRWTNSSSSFQNMHDLIFWYAKSSQCKTFNQSQTLPSQYTLKRMNMGWHTNTVRYEGGRRKQYIVYDRAKFEKNCKRIDPNARIVYREATTPKVAPPDVLEIPILNSQSNERIGYPTQKPEELLHKLIFTASNESDTVLDPFVGGGTTLAVADKLRRRWIGIDQSVAAIKVTENRLQQIGATFETIRTIQTTTQ